MEKYEFLQRIAEGAYGTVWKCLDKETGAIRAVKKLKEAPANSEDHEFALREVKLLQLVNHKNVVKLLEAYQSQSGRLYLVFEYVEHTVLQLVRNNRQGLAVNQVKSILWQMLQAVSYLHKKKIIHRDLKPSNILVSNNGMVKICDFGFARPMGHQSVADYTTYVVTRWYRAPEVLVGDSYGPGVDIWAIGCILAELATGRPLFPGKTQHDQLWLILKSIGRMTDRQLELLDEDPQFACFRLPMAYELEPLETKLPNFTPLMMQLLKACLHPDSKKRPNADELMTFPFFAGVQDVLPNEKVGRHLEHEVNEVGSKLDKLAKEVAQPAAATAAAGAAAAKATTAALMEGAMNPMAAAAAAAALHQPMYPQQQQQQQQQQQKQGSPPRSHPAAVQQHQHQHQHQHQQRPAAAKPQTGGNLSSELGDASVSTPGSHPPPPAVFADMSMDLPGPPGSLSTQGGSPPGKRTANGVSQHGHYQSKHDAAAAAVAAVAAAASGNGASAAAAAAANGAKGKRQTWHGTTGMVPQPPAGPKLDRAASHGDRAPAPQSILAPMPPADRPTGNAAIPSHMNGVSGQGAMTGPAAPGMIPHQPLLQPLQHPLLHPEAAGDTAAAAARPRPRSRSATGEHVSSSSLPNGRSTLSSSGIAGEDGLPCNPAANPAATYQQHPSMGYPQHNHQQQSHQPSRSTHPEAAPPDARRAGPTAPASRLPPTSRNASAGSTAVPTVQGGLPGQQGFHRNSSDGNHSGDNVGVLGSGSAIDAVYDAVANIDGADGLMAPNGGRRASDSVMGLQSNSLEKGARLRVPLAKPTNLTIPGGNNAHQQYSQPHQPQVMAVHTGGYAASGGRQHRAHSYDGRTDDNGSGGGGGNASLPRLPQVPGRPLEATTQRVTPRSSSTGSNGMPAAPASANHSVVAPGTHSQSHARGGLGSVYPDPAMLPAPHHLPSLHSMGSGGANAYTAAMVAQTSAGNSHAKQLGGGRASNTGGGLEGQRSGGLASEEVPDRLRPSSRTLGMGVAR